MSNHQRSFASSLVNGLKPAIWIGFVGVWEKSRSYPGLTTQNTGDTYSFSDYHSDAVQHYITRCRGMAQCPLVST
ncbi:hypothetical protein LC613_18895 [Nostoc sphaeroides CHAB 2801]|uniref:hypothetical protein n=1 Tax=Nostoc sphaeroides TaxID=446679 RepID=UPI0011C11C1C|nr:hypothetical protein [Nostoc sphaeroides]MCC5629994.1 hypothetical protein [Nostoc sphaeroides CHAB 2801]